LAAIVKGVGSGDLTPSEGKALASLVEISVRSHELIDHEKRLVALEERQHG
jgi:hypothetical protein